MNDSCLDHLVVPGPVVASVQSQPQPQARSPAPQVCRRRFSPRAAAWIADFGAIWKRVDRRFNPAPVVLRFATVSSLVSVQGGNEAKTITQERSLGSWQLLRRNQ